MFDRQGRSACGRGGESACGILDSGVDEDICRVGRCHLERSPADECRDVPARGLSGAGAAPVTCQVGGTVGTNGPPSSRSRSNASGGLVGAGDALGLRLLGV
jgi:hypothetical protein